MSDNLKELGPRLERWLPAYEKDDISIKVSNNGRLMMRVRDEHCILPCTDMVQLVQGMIRAMADHGFPPEPPEPNEPFFMKAR
jgi:hypothetical protein